MTAQAFDVVVVADFSPPVSRRFEIMTLFFLASWLEFGGRSRDLPLHIACIGEVPESVRSLGGRCGVEFTVHSPFFFGGFANKLRGFEINPKTDHVLLLDADMLVLSEFHELPEALGQKCIAAAAANGPAKGGRESWKAIYELFGIQIPQNQVIPLNIELDTFHCGTYRPRRTYFPYYNGGIIFAPWRSEMGRIWQDHIVRIESSGYKITGAGGKASNQPSLATTIAYLQSRGFDFQLLPREYHVRWQHIAAGAISSQEARLLHTIGFGRWSHLKKNKTAEEEIDIYLSNTLSLTKKLRSHRGLYQRVAYRATRRPQVRDCYRVHGLMRLLYGKYVRELKQ